MQMWRFTIDRIAELKVLIICRQQFGYLRDTYSYSRYLSRKHQIVYLDWNYQLPEIGLDNVIVQHVSRSGNRFARYLRYIVTALRIFKNNEFDITLVSYFPGCFLLPIFFPEKKYVLDIRSGCISSSNLKRFFINGLLSFEALFYTNKIVISRSLSNYLALNDSTVIPVGAESISQKPKAFNRMDLLYVGTLRNRNIEMTIEGLKLFLDNCNDAIPITYKIIGDGCPGQLDKLKKLVDKYELHGIVKILGKIQYDHLHPFFEECNIGVSFVPITDYYDVQPPTKTFEYLLSGMPVIATETLEHMHIINRNNGILIHDSASGFSRGLQSLFENRTLYNSNEIVQASIEYRWDNITCELETYLTDRLDSC